MYLKKLRIGQVINLYTKESKTSDLRFVLSKNEENYEEENKKTFLYEYEKDSKNSVLFLGSIIFYGLF